MRGSQPILHLISFDLPQPFDSTPFTLNIKSGSTGGRAKIHPTLLTLSLEPWTLVPGKQALQDGVPEIVLNS